MYPPSEYCIPLFSLRSMLNAIDLRAATMVVSVMLKVKNPEKKFGMAVDVRFLI